MPPPDVEPAPRPPAPAGTGAPAAAGAWRAGVPRDPRKERLLDLADAGARLLRRRFRLDGRTYPYLLHAHNRTGRNERCVEVPYVLAQVRACRGRVLEIGHVLRHYVPGLDHTVVDKYERAPGVVNADVVDYRPPLPFDLVVSISTLEHVGWDEEPRDAEKAPRAIAHLIAHCLAPGGRLVVTWPLGYNPSLDVALVSGRLPFDRTLVLERRGRYARWRESHAAAVRGARYGEPHPFANALVIGLFEGRPVQNERNRQPDSA